MDFGSPLQEVITTGNKARHTHCKYGHVFSEENTYINPSSGDRSCRTCQKKWAKQYYLKPGTKEKILAYHDSRKDTYREQSRLRRQNRRKFIAEIKNRPCLDCGLRFPYYVMDLDHVRGEKKVNVSALVDDCTTIKKLMEEVDKCDIVCANCHRIRTYKRKKDKVDYELR